MLRFRLYVRASAFGLFKLFQQMNLNVLTAAGGGDQSLYVFRYALLFYC